jgi:hypothetical protein
MDGGLARPGTVLAGYIVAARSILHGDPSRAWTPNQLRVIGVDRGLIAPPVSDDLFKKALEMTLDNLVVERKQDWRSH